MADQGLLRVAIVGAGPAGFFAAAELLKVPFARVDVYDRLPAPFGLVRHGVAPDHPMVKSVTERYHESAHAAGTRFRLLGNVEVGRDVSLAELKGRYHAGILAYGANQSRRLDIPGAGLLGVHSASTFVGFYNGHPDCAQASFDLSADRAVVVGVGNVALDVARVLLKPLHELARTDISDRALRVLEDRRVREVVLLGRSGPAQAAFTPPELSEMGQIEGCDLVIASQDRVLDPETARRVQLGTLDNLTGRKLDAIALARPSPRPGRKVVRVRLWTSPVEIVGLERAEAVRLQRNRMEKSPSGSWQLVPEGPTELLEAGLVFSSIGYQVEPLPDAPFDPKGGVVPHRRGQVLDGGAPVPGLFVTGWAKRGPHGVIGANKPDAQETTRCLLEAWRAQALPAPQGEEIEALLQSRGVAFVSYPDWRLLDTLEVDAGQDAGRPRRKFVDAESMLRALAQSGPEEPAGKSDAG